MPEIILTTTPVVPGYKVEKIIGVLFGTTVRTRGLGGRFIAGLEALGGGKSDAYLQELDKARNEAIEELRRKAEERGANAVIGLDLDVSEVLEGFIMVAATGTAVVLRRE